MKVHDKVVVVTGGANGIGRALCRRFAAEGARAVVVADLDGVAAKRVADEIGGLAIETDIARESGRARLVTTTVREARPMDLFCSDAGIAISGGEETENAQGQRAWDVNLMAHVYAARHVLP